MRRSKPSFGGNTMSASASLAIDCMWRQRDAMPETSPRAWESGFPI
jgi:hypothetical protein